MKLNCRPGDTAIIVRAGTTLKGQKCACDIGRIVHVHHLINGDFPEFEVPIWKISPRSTPCIHMPGGADGYADCLLLPLPPEENVRAYDQTVALPVERVRAGTEQSQVRIAPLERAPVHKQGD